MLEGLIRSLSRQITDSLFSMSIVVVDNDSTGSARETAQRLEEELGLDLTYSIETERTIPAVRNHALRVAKGDHIGIIDDDEFAPNHWLITLYRAMQTFNVDGALGPVHPFFESTPPDWLIKSGFCERPVYRTGTLLKWNQTRTGNVLLKRDVFDRHGLRFDETMRTGGTDREFFKHAMQQGSRFVAVEEAPVYEVVPQERWTKSYYFRRALVNGFNAYKNNREGRRGLRRVTEPAKSALAVAAYAAAAPVCTCLGTHRLMNCAVRGGHHLSQLCALAGIELVKRRDF